MKKRNEYGSNRSYVIVHLDEIRNELRKGRTVKSIWQEFVDKKNCNIQYRSFLYNVNTLISQKEIKTLTKDDHKEKKATSPSKNFDFNPQIDIEEII